MKKRKPGTIFSVAVTMGLLLLLVICTFFGDEIYQKITPHVPVHRSNELIDREGKKYTRVRKEAVSADSELFYLVSEQGFSREIYRIYCKKVDSVWDEYSDKTILITTELPKQCYIVNNPEKGKGIADGSKVVPEK